MPFPCCSTIVRIDCPAGRVWAEEGERAVISVAGAERSSGWILHLVWGRAADQAAVHARGKGRVAAPLLEGGASWPWRTGCCQRFVSRGRCADLQPSQLSRHCCLCVDSPLRLRLEGR